MGLEHWQPYSHFMPRGSQRFPFQVGMKTAQGQKDARLAEDSEGTGPATMECPGLAGQRSPCPSSKIPTWSTNYFPLGAEQGRPKPLATWPNTLQ